MTEYVDHQSNKLSLSRCAVDTASYDAWRTKHWQPLIDKHPQWAARLGAEAHYILPSPVTDALAQIPQRTREAHAIITAADANAERAFAAACAAYGPATIGVWGGTPLHYPLLEGYHEGRRSLDASDADDPESARMVARQVAYVGWLAFNTTYRAELKALRKQWGKVSDMEGNPAPFARYAFAIRDVTSVPLRHFYLDYEAFCQHWSLKNLLTWDLSWPIPPQRGVPIGALLADLGATSRVDYEPAYVASSPGPSTIIQASGARAPGRRLSEPASAARRTLARYGGGTSQFETALHMWLTELAVRRRYGAPRGATARLVEAFAEMFELSAERIKRIRRLYRTCLPTVRHAHDAAKTGAR